MEYNKLYECIDDFGIGIIREIVEPVKRGEDIEKVLEAAASNVWDYYQKNKGGYFGQEPGTIHLKAKRDDYGLGKWSLEGLLIIDLDGEHSDLKEYLKYRLSRFVSMVQEYYLLNTLVALGYKGREVSAAEDSLGKVDLFVTIDEIEYAVSVFRDTTNSREKALNKLGRCSIDIPGVRVFFAFDKYTNSTQSEEHVEKWIEGIKRGGYKFGKK